MPGVEFLLSLLGYAITPLKWLGGKMGLTSRPQIVFGKLSANAQDRRPSYRHLYNLECVNRQRSGWLGKRSRTHNAHGCRAELQFQLTSGDSFVVRADAIITPGPNSGTVMTLFTDKPAAIPVYWQADGIIPHPTQPGTQAYPAGYYIAGAEFLIYGEVAQNWRLDPGIYLVTVRLIWNGESTDYEFDLSVPSTGRTGNE